MEMKSRHHSSSFFISPTEIIEYSSPEEIAVCNLASIAVNMFVRNDKTYDFERLKDVAKVSTKLLSGRKTSFFVPLFFDLIVNLSS